MEKVIQPDIGWYTATSREMGVGPRCPFASVHRCPRHYESLSLLGQFGNTAISADQDKQLLERWKDSDLWPVVDEQAVSIMSNSQSPTMFSNFCPEVAYDTYGIFADFFSRVGDELDRELRHQRLVREGAAPTDYRWNWTSATPLHYTACPIYSLLLHNQTGRSSLGVQSKPALLARLKESKTAKWLAVGGAALAGVAKWADSLRKLWETWMHR